MCDCLRFDDTSGCLPAIDVSRDAHGSLCGREERELQAGPAAVARCDSDFPCEVPSHPVEDRARAFSRILAPCRGVAKLPILPESVGFTPSVLPRVTPNQAMQLTATRLAFNFCDDFLTFTPINARSR